MIGDSEIATAAVTALTTYLTVGATEAVKTLSAEASRRVVGLYDKVKARLTPAGSEALADLEQAPADLDAQATLRQQLRKQLPNDSTLLADLAALVEALRPASLAGSVQTSTITGFDNVNIQIAGSDNVVMGGFGKPR